MAFKDPEEQPDFANLYGILANTRLQKTNNALYETIFLLIGKAIQSRDLIVKAAEAETGVVQGIAISTFLTAADESTILVNSRQLLAGSGVTFDDSIPNRRTVNATAVGTGGYWTPLTDGNVDETNLIFANGEAIAVFVPV